MIQEHRVWFTFQTVGGGDLNLYIPATSVEHAAIIIEALTAQQQHNASITSNAFGLELWNDETNEWVEYVSPEGVYICDAMWHDYVHFDKNVEFYCMD